MVGAGKLLLLACAAELGLVPVTVDDPQWVDRESARRYCSRLGGSPQMPSHFSSPPGRARRTGGVDGVERLALVGLSRV